MLQVVILQPWWGTEDVKEHAFHRKVSQEKRKHMILEGFGYDRPGNSPEREILVTGREFEPQGRGRVHREGSTSRTDGNRWRWCWAFGVSPISPK